MFFGPRFRIQVKAVFILEGNHQTISKQLMLRKLFLGTMPTELNYQLLSLYEINKFYIIKSIE